MQEFVIKVVFGSISFKTDIKSQNNLRRHIIFRLLFYYYMDLYIPVEKITVAVAFDVSIHIACWNLLVHRYAHLRKKPSSLRK